MAMRSKTTLPRLPALRPQVHINGTVRSGLPKTVQGQLTAALTKTQLSKFNHRKIPWISTERALLDHWGRPHSTPAYRGPVVASSRGMGARKSKFRENRPAIFREMVSSDGFEPSATALKVRCSTAELRARPFRGAHHRGDPLRGQEVRSDCPRSAETLKMPGPAP